MTMQPEMSPRDLEERLDLIEAMIAEGRKQTESWGWTFLLWGIAYYVAIAWASWGQAVTILGGRVVAWPVTMVATVLVTIALALRRGNRHPGTAVGRAVGDLWIAVGITMLVLLPALAVSGRLEPNVFVSIVAGILGVANGASGLILRWKVQMACAAVWWTTCAAAPFCSSAALAAVFLSAVFLCQILFGAYAMSQDARRHGAKGAVHA